MATSLLTAPAVARAEGPVTGTAKGIVGGAFLGAEVVMMPMGIAGLKPWWPYLVFGGVGAAGGAVGGWAVEQATVDGPAEPALYMLAGGLALVIPTLVLTLNATTKKNYDDDSTTTTTPAPSTETKPGEKQPDGSTVTVTSDAKKQLKRKRTKEHPTAPTAAIDLSGDAVRLGIPAVVVKPMYSEVEISQFGVQQHTEVRIPVFSAAF
ncbi:MAG: hypothetical protein U0414_17215 [Polyangiaceae bacterium]